MSHGCNLLAEISARILNGIGFEEAFRDAVAALRRHLPCDAAFLAFAHPEHAYLVLGPSQAPKKAGLHTGERIESAPSLLKVLAGRPWSIPDLAKETEREPASWKKALRAAGMRAALVVPLGQSLGALWIASKRAGPIPPGDADFARLTAHLLALLLLRGQLAARSHTQSVRRVEAASERDRLAEENRRLHETLLQGDRPVHLIGESPVWQRLLRQVELVAASDATVLIRGETGTGKEPLARAVHRLSKRAHGPFVAVNCAALAPELIASELFGHEKGAFTGAAGRRIGRMELARGGTLFLDEIGDLALDLQVKLLRVLQEREFERVGGNETLRSDARVIAATNRDLEAARAEGRFRDDLFFRLNVFPIRVPPLRERKEDIEPLIRHFLPGFAAKVNKRFERLDPGSLMHCLDYHWPGNVRELENIVERAVIVCAGPVLYLDPFAETGAVAGDASPLKLHDAIRSHLIRAIKLSSGKIYGEDGAARLLGLKPSTLQAKLKRYGIDRRGVFSI